MLIACRARLQRLLDAPDVGILDHVAKLIEHPFVAVDQPLQPVFELADLAPLEVGLRVAVGLGDEALDLGLGEAAGGIELDALGEVGRHVARRDVDDAVGVDGEGHLDLRHAARRRRDADQLEAAERLVLGGELALALEDVDLHGALVVHHGGEDLRVLGRDRRVALDQLGEQPALRLDAERERGDVEQHQVLDVAAQDAPLDGGAHGDHLVGVDLAVRLAAEDPLDRLGDQGGAGLAADQQHLVDLVGAQAGAGEGVEAGPLGARDEVAHQVLELPRG